MKEICHCEEILLVSCPFLNLLVGDYIVHYKTFPPFFCYDLFPSYWSLKCGVAYELFIPKAKSERSKDTHAKLKYFPLMLPSEIWYALEY